LTSSKATPPLSLGPETPPDKATTRAIEAAEAAGAARERRCRAASLDTFTFQTPNFYERLGYWEFGRLNDFPPAHARISFWRSL
jgi:hypothetical protein